MSSEAAFVMDLPAVPDQIDERNLLAPTIPTVTVTSSDDVDHIEEVVREIEDVSTQEWEELSETEDKNMERPTHLSLGKTLVNPASSSPSPETENGKEGLKHMPETTDIGLTAAEGPMLMPQRHSQPNLSLTSSSGHLSPGIGVGGYESDFSMTSGGLTDYDDCESSPRKVNAHLFKERADSDPTESLSPRRKAMKSLKSLKSNFKQKSTKSPAESPTNGTVRMVGFDNKKIDKKILSELALGTIMMEEDGVHPDTKSSDGKENAKKNGKLKWKRNKKKQLSRVAQKISEKQVLSPSYKQKNVDFHKFFKDLPQTERLLVDYTCALMKDILVQGRLYVSQNYLCFHSNILKWQTAVTVKLVDIDTMTKEKTVKVIPNAIQFMMKDKSKMTFTSFTARDRAYLMTFKLWQNALLEKPMSGRELWCQIHSNYGEELGLCSSDDDYVKPEHMPRKHQSIGDADGEVKYEFGTTNKIIKKKKKKSSSSTQTPREAGANGNGLHKASKSDSNRHSSQDSSNGFIVGTDSTGDDKSLPGSQCSQDDMFEDEEVLQGDEGITLEENEKNAQAEVVAEIPVEDDDDEPAEFILSDCAKISLSCKYETSARDMFRIIFGDDCPFWRDTLVNKQSTEIELGTWYDDEEVKGQRLRDLSYTLKLDNPIGPKTSHCKETQILYPNSIEGKTYAVDCIVQNYGIPYADYFQTCMRYCIRKVTRGSCHVRVTSELRYKKTPWGLIKNFIEKNVASGLSDNFKKLEFQLQERIELERQQVANGETKEKDTSEGRRVRNRRAGRKRSAPEDPAQTSSSSLPIGSQRSDVNNNDQVAKSPTVVAGAPPLTLANGFIPNSRFASSESPKLQFFGPGGRLISGAIVFIFLLLIYNNYSMYQRLATLEQVTAAAATADGVDPSVTAALLDRPGIPISSSPEILSTYLQAIDKRLRRLEDTMGKFAESSGKKWTKMESDWSQLNTMIRTVLRQKNGGGG